MNLKTKIFDANMFLALADRIAWVIGRDMNKRQTKMAIGPLCKNIETLEGSPVDALGIIIFRDGTKKIVTLGAEDGSTKKPSTD